MVFDETACFTLMISLPVSRSIGRSQLDAEACGFLKGARLKHEVILIVLCQCLVDYRRVSEWSW